MTGQVMCGVKDSLHTHTHTHTHTLTGNSGMSGLMTLAVIDWISVEARQPFSSSTVTTSTLVCSASKCSLATSSPSLAATTTD